MTKNRLLRMAGYEIPAAAREAAGALLLLPVYVAMNLLLERVTHLSTANYFDASLSLAMLRQSGWILTGVALAAAILLARFGHLLARWDELEFGTGLRAFVLILAVTIAWPLVTAGVNFYFDRNYTAEKLLLVALVPLAWWRPVFVYPLLMIAYVLLWQLAEPALGGTVLAHKLQVLRGLTVFAAAFLVYAVCGDRRLPGFLLLLCSFVASAYWLPFVAKFELSWLGSDPLYLVPLSAWAHGWLAFLPAERMVAIADAIRPFSGAMKLFVMLAEGLCLVFLWRRPLSIALLCAVIGFHLGVFALYGFLFWTWITLDVALLMLLLRMPADRAKSLYRMPSLALSVVLILLAAHWAKSPALGWYDTPLTYSYRIEAFDERGRGSYVHPSFFAPYDDVFTMAAFDYAVSDHATLVQPYGVTTDRDIMTALLHARRAEEVFALEAGESHIRYEEARKLQLQQFLRLFVEHRARRAAMPGWLAAVRAPQQFTSFRGELPDAGDIREMALVEVSTFYDFDHLSDIRRRELFRIRFDDAAGEALP